MRPVLNSADCTIVASTRTRHIEQVHNSISRLNSSGGA
jgi:hypothetical protein